MGAFSGLSVQGMDCRLAAEALPLLRGNLGILVSLNPRRPVKPAFVSHGSTDSNLGRPGGRIGPWKKVKTLSAPLPTPHSLFHYGKKPDLGLSFFVLVVFLQSIVLVSDVASSPALISGSAQSSLFPFGIRIRHGSGLFTVSVPYLSPSLSS